MVRRPYTLQYRFVLAEATTEVKESSPITGTVRNMPRSVRSERSTRVAQRSSLTQQSYSFNRHQLVTDSGSSPEKDADPASSFITKCEAWAVEAFSLPADFLYSLSESTATKTRYVVVRCDFSRDCFFLFLFLDIRM